MMGRIGALPLAACVLLSACGGGGGNGGPGSPGSSPPPNGGSPSPSPSPTPSPSSTIGDLRGDQTFATTASATQVAFNTTTKTTVVGTKAAGVVSVSYDAASKTYSLSDGSQAQQFAPADIIGSGGGETRYQKADGANRAYLTLVTTPYTSATANKYVGLGYWQRNAVNGTQQDTYFSTFTYGFETPATGVPRTGNASFNIDVFGLASTPGYEPKRFQGSGKFYADLLNGVFSAQAYTTETGLISDNGVVGGGIEVDAAGHLSSSDGSFSGNALYGGTNGQIAGTIAGKFYGPGAAEIGASFSGSNADGASFNGALTGQRDAVTQLANLTLTNIVTSQLFYTGEADLTYTSFDNDAASPYTRTMTLISQLNRQDAEAFSYGPGISNLPGGNFTITAKVAGNDPNFTYYQKNFNGQDVYLELYKPGAANTELALTYASFGRWRTSKHESVSTTADQVFLAYGLQTQAGLLAAKTGTARYTGVAYGAAANDKTRAQYDVKGRSSFEVDFGAQNMTAAIALQGKSTNGAGDIDFGTFAGSAKIGSYNGENVVNFVEANAQYGSLATRFYGPDGEEIAGPFTLVVVPGRLGEGTQIAGVAVAKRP